MVEMVIMKTGRVPKLAVVLWGVEFGKPKKVLRQ
jgi:hypothetical protein